MKTFLRILVLAALFVPSAFAEEGYESLFDSNLPPGSQPEEPKPENPCKPDAGGQDGGHTGGNPCVPKDR